MSHQLYPCVRISLEHESVRILGFSQIFARRKVCSSTFEATDFCLKQRLWISLAVYSSGNIAFNRDRRFEEIRSDLFPLSSVVSPFAICLRKGKRQRGEGEIGGREGRRVTNVSRAQISRASFREPPQFHGKLQSVAKRGRMLNFREKLRRAVTRRHDEYAPRFLLNSTRDKLQVSTALSKRKERL